VDVKNSEIYGRMIIQNGDNCRSETKDCSGKMLIHIHSGRRSTVPCVEVRELIAYLGNLRNNSEGISSEMGNIHEQKECKYGLRPNHFFLC
jgi:hypothetical protein